MQRLNFKYTAHRFAYWRVLFGSFLFYYSLRIWPYAVDLYSDLGPMKGLYGATSFPTSNFEFPGLLLFSATEIWIEIVASLQVLLSFLFLIGFHRRIVALLLWFVMASLYNKNPTTYSIELPYHGWLLLCCALIPEGDFLKKEKCKSEWKMSPVLYWGAWIILGISYSYMGYTKFFTPRWWDGGATTAILKGYHGYTWVRPILDAIPIWLFVTIDRGFLLTEFLAGPGYFFKLTRPYVWLITFFMHIAILMTMNIPQISLGMFVIHLFLFDENWISQLNIFRRSKNQVKS